MTIRSSPATAALASATRESGLPLQGPMAKLRLSALNADHRALAPDVSALNEAGVEKHVSDHRGQVILLNFWATWCLPCIQEMPALSRLQQRWRTEKAAALVLPISLDRAGVARVQEFYTRHNLANLPLRNDASGMAGRAFGLRGLPTSILIDRKGREVGRLEGEAPWDGVEAAALFAALCNEP